LSFEQNRRPNGFAVLPFCAHIEDIGDVGGHLPQRRNSFSFADPLMEAISGQKDKETL
jgi:hypothetical protein